MSDGRRICPACGSNNFETQAACWKCGKPLTGASAPAASPTPPSPNAWIATIALGLLFPLVAVPVGLVFLMLDDPRKTQIGRWNLLWGTIGTLVHLVGTLFLARVALLPFTAMAESVGKLSGSASQSRDVDQGGKILDGAFPSPR